MSDLRRGPWDSRLLPMTPDTPDTTPDKGSEGWTTTEAAARALRVTPRTIRRYIDDGRLVGRRVKRGRARPYEVAIASLKALRTEMIVAGDLTVAANQEEITVGGYEDPPEESPSAYVQLARALAEATARAARAETRAELTEVAETTAREELRDLENKWVEAQQEAFKLRLRVDQLEGELQRERSNPWYRRLFG